MKGWFGKAKRKEKDSGKSEGKQKMVEEVDAEIAGGDDNELEIGVEMGGGGCDVVDASTLPRWTAINMVSTSLDKS